MGCLVTTKIFVNLPMPLRHAYKVIHLIFDMDKMVGEDFEAGLADLKATAERSSSPAG